jgi:alkylation response protein AidB-like acyl-CoA dehydrogenase
MDFDFTDDQEMLRDTVRKWVEKDYGFERRRAIVKAGGFSREAWQGLADLGLTGLAVPEAQGGMGFGAGRRDGGDGRAGPRPGARALRRGVAGRDASARRRPAPSASLWLEGIAQGKERVVLAQEERRSRYRLGQ